MVFSFNYKNNNILKNGLIFFLKKYFTGKSKIFFFFVKLFLIKLIIESGIFF